MKGYYFNFIKKALICKEDDLDRIQIKIMVLINQLKTKGFFVIMRLLSLS